MSYDIYIGNAVMQQVEDQFDVIVDEVQSVDAPEFPNDQMTGKENHRHPAYSGWSGFCDEAGLTEMFFDEDTGLMREHPGTFALKESHLKQIREAVRRWKGDHPNSVPGFAGGICKDPEPVPPNVDHILARLLWLEFWVDWALDNCKHPAIHNH